MQDVIMLLLEEIVWPCMSMKHCFVITLLDVFLLSGFEFHPNRGQSNGLSLQSPPALPAANS